MAAGIIRQWDNYATRRITADGREHWSTADRDMRETEKYAATTREKNPSDTVTIQTRTVTVTRDTAGTVTVHRTPWAPVTAA